METKNLPKIRRVYLEDTNVYEVLLKSFIDYIRSKVKNPSQK